MRATRFIQFCLVAVLAIGFSPLGVAAQSNSETAHACQKGGWQTLKRGEDNSRSRNQGDCVSYGAQGGTVVAISPSVSLTFTYTGYSVGYLHWCLPQIALADLEPNTEYTVSHPVDGDPLPYASTVTTDSTGGVVFTPFSYRNYNIMRVDVAGLTTGWVPIVCGP